jgi:hypothetical protein
MDIGEKHICPCCGQEIENGLMNHVKHTDECPNDAPNESIEFHVNQLKIRNKQISFSRDLHAVYAAADNIEKEMLFRYYCIGIPEGDVRLYGNNLFLEFTNYIEELKTKYKIKC